MTDDHASPFYGKDRMAAYREEGPRKVPECLPLVTHEQEEAMLRDAGFKDI